MPVVKGREYRQMFQPLMIPQGTENKRFDTDFYVEGFATTFDKPYVMYEYGGIKYCEVIDRNALVGADLSDVIMQFDHSGMVFARNKMAKNKPPSLLLEPQDGGLFIAANLSLTEEAKRLYASIDAGLICKMSWAFTVSEDAYNKDTHTRTILKIKKVYDGILSGERRYRYFGAFLFRRSDRERTAGAAGAPEANSKNQTYDGGLTQ